MGLDLTKSVVCILDQDANPVGTGFAVRTDLIATCAHVVRMANSEPGKQISFLSYLGNRKIGGQVDEMHWRETEAGDIAFIRVEENIPNLEPLELAVSSEMIGKEYSCFGFPKNTGESVGEADTGTIEALVITKKGYPRLQLASNKIRKGYSGAPVVDLMSGRAVGMVAWGRDETHEQVVLAITTESIVKAWPGLKIAEWENLKAPFMVEPLPKNFVKRPEEFEQIVTAVLDQGKVRPVGITAALKGAGGYGKTTLARAVCWDNRVREAFPDGILWVTLGQNPSEPALVGKIGDLFRAMNEEWKGYSEAVPAAEDLRGLLKERKVLLVVDDVWQPEHLQLFLQDESLCMVLATTRVERTLPEETKKINIDAMLQAESVQLLCAGLPPGEEDAAGRLAKQLGDWALLLNLVNGVLRGRIRRGQSVKEAFEAVSKAYQRGGVAIFDTRDADQRQEAVALTLQASIDPLKPDDRAMFFDLAVFAEDTDIPLAAVEILWGIDPFQVEEYCRFLAEDSLLLRFDMEKRTIRLHDVVRNYLIRQQDAQKLHERLMETYRKECPDGWHTGPKNGHFFRWLMYHLTEAGQKKELETLLFDFNWIDAHLRNGGINELLEDYEYREGLGEAVERLAGLVQGALRMSAHVLSKDVDQLAGQILARLLAFEEPAIQALVAQCKEWHNQPWLQPIRPCLFPPGGAERRTLAGHPGAINAVAISPDGWLAVSGSADKTIKIWDLTTGTELRTVGGHSGAITAVAISPDGRLAVSGLDDNTLKVWELATGNELRTLAGHTDSISAVAISPDGQWVISGSYDNTLKIWDLATGIEQRTLTGHSSWVTGVAISPEGRRVISSSGDRTLKVWDLDSGNGTEPRTMIGHSNWVTGVAISPNGQWAVSSSSDQTLKVWDIATGSELRTLTGHTDGVSAVTISPDGQLVVSGSWDHTLKAWDLASGLELRTLAGHSGSVSTVTISRDGRLVISGSEDNTVKIWDLASSMELHTLEGHSDRVSAVAVSPDGQLAVSGSWDYTLKVWNMTSGTELQTIAGIPDGVSAVAISPDGRWMVSGIDDNTLKVWDLINNLEVYTLMGHSEAITGVAISSDSHWAVSSSEDSTLKVWDLSSGKELRTLTGHLVGATGVAITPDGRWVISCSLDHTLKIWDLASGTELRTLVGHPGGVTAVAISQDGRWVISGSLDHTLKIWDIASGTEFRTLEGHSDSLSAVAISPDGRWVVSGSLDDTLKVWDLKNGTCCTFTANGQVTSCTAAPDSRTFVAGDAGGLLYFLRLSGIE